MQDHLIKFLIFPLMLVLLASCGIENFVTSNKTTIIKGKVPSLAGQVTQRSTGLFNAFASDCQARVELFKLDEEDDFILPSIASTQVLPSGEFSLEVPSIVLMGNEVKHMLEVISEGSCQATLRRPLTTPEQLQIITPFTTVISFAKETEMNTKLNEVSKKQMELLLAESEHILTTEDAYTELSLNRSERFAQVFSGAAPSSLELAPPIVQTGLLPPTAIDEQSVHNLKVEAYHWNNSYPMRYQWKLNGQMVSNLAHWTYTPSANEAGNKELQILIGQDNGAGGVDLSKPYQQIEHSFVVNNSILPSLPQIDVSSLLLTQESLALQIHTGANLIHCQSFAQLCFGFGNEAPNFNFQCTDDVIQNHTLTLPSTQGRYSLYFYAKDQLGVVTKSQQPIVITYDNTPPQINTFTITEGDSSANNNIRININAQDNVSNINEFCLKFNDSLTPSGSDQCWKSVSAPSPGLSPQQEITILDYYYLIGFSPGNYNIYAWVKDELGHITNTAAQASILYSPGTPPQFLQLGAFSNNSPETPPSNSDLFINQGQNVFIKWSVSDDRVLPPSPISLYYTQNDLDYHLIAADLSNSINGGCSLEGGYSGCYLWAGGAPTDGYFKIRVVAQDDSSMKTFASTQPLNVMPPIRFLAGNTDLGLGGSASSAIFFSSLTNSSIADPNSLAVASNGTIYFRDSKRGILKVDPSTGMQEVYIPTTGASTGDGGPVSNATLHYPFKINLDYQDRLIIFDHDVIRMVDTNTHTIDRLIGGGSSDDDNIAALSLKIIAPDHRAARDIPLVPLPNGDLVFMSRMIQSTPSNGTRLNIYQAATQTVKQLHFTGTGFQSFPDIPIAGCTLYATAIGIDPTTSSMNRILAQVRGGTTACPTPSVSNFYGANFDPQTGSLLAPHPSIGASTHYTTAKTGEIYSVARNMLRKFNQVDGTWEHVIGKTAQGSCPDGTLASDCHIDLMDAYVNRAGQIYFVDRGRIRTFDHNQRVLTLFGQSFSHGDGEDALASRFNVINSIALAPNNKIIVLDQEESLFREFSIGGSIQTIAGNGQNATPSLTVTSDQTSVITKSHGSFFDDFVADPLTGDIFFNQNAAAIIKLNRQTNMWQRVVGPGATKYSAGDGLLGSNISFGNYPPRLIGYSSKNILAMLQDYQSPSIINGYFKLYDQDDEFRQTNLLGRLGVNGGAICADGSTEHNCNLPSGYSNHFSRAHFNQEKEEWYFLIQNNNQIKKMSVGGTMANLTSLTYPALSFTYVVSNEEELLFYCANDGRLYKKNITLNEESALLWPVTSMSCKGRSLLYHETRKTLIFPYMQNGLYGIAEYLNP